MSASSQIDWNTNAPILAPDGAMHAVPLAALPQALADPSLKRAVPMADPQGNHHWVPEDLIPQAVQTGNRISWPADQQIPKWFGFTPSNVAANAWSGAKGLVTGIASLGKDLASNPNWFEGSGSTYDKFIAKPAEQQVVQARQVLNNTPLPPSQEPPLSTMGLGERIRELGRNMSILGPASGHALASAIPMIGPWAAGLGKQAGSGDVGGAAGQAAGAIAAGTAIANAPKMLNDVIPSTVRAGQGLSNLTDTPNAVYGQTPVVTPKADAVAKQIESQLAVTGEKPPAIIQNHLGNMLLQGAPTQFGLQQGPLSMWEARTTLKRVNDLIDASGGFNADTASKTMLNAYKRYAGALDTDISNAAQQGGFGNTYEGFRSEYAKGKGIQRAADAAGPLIGGGLGAYLGRETGAIGMAEAAGAGTLAGRYLGKPVVGSMVDSVIGRSGQPVTARPPLPPVPRSPEEYTRTILAAKEGQITPAEASARIRRGGGSTRVSPLPPPP